MKKNDLIKYIILVIGIICFTFSSGRYNLFICAWIWPALLLYFARRSNKKDLILLIILLMIGNIIKWNNIIGYNFFIDGLICMVWSIFWIIPFIIEYYFYPKNKKSILRIFLFPISFLLMEFIALYMPQSSIGMIAYTQSNISYLIQIVSIIGSFGLSFIIYLFSTIINEVIDNKKYNYLIIYFILIIFILIYGYVRINNYKDSDNNVKIASIIGPYYGKFNDYNFKELSYEEELEYLESEINRSSGADYAVINEDAYYINDNKENEFISYLKDKAISKNMVLIIAYNIIDTDNSDNGLSLNKLVMVDTNGNVIEYYKNYLVPFVETLEYKKVSSNVTVLNTDKANITSIICFDDTHINLLYHINNEDILFVPSWDWSEAKDIHFNSSKFRTIENGITLVKPTYDGISVIYNYLGNTIYEKDITENDYDSVDIISVNINKKETIYSRYGYILDSIYLVLSIGITLFGITKCFKKKSKR